MITFDQVLPTLLRECDRSAVLPQIERWCAIRDIRGRVRLVVTPRSQAVGIDLGGLEGSLRLALGRYFAPPILSTAWGDDRGRLARAIAQARNKSPWEDAAYEDPETGKEIRPRGEWHKLERRLSKLAWLEEGEPSPPWELVSSMPPVVAFHSFKGGVGRTLALAACAWQWAKEGRRVAIVDLDLEAPGIGSLLGVETRRGVLDFVVDFLATDARGLDDMAAQPAAVLGAEAERVQVFPAGSLGPSYLDKLARLDFASSGPSEVDQGISPAGEALRALLLEIAHQEPKPDYILLDSRAGLHDLAGLALHGLAHVDVLFSRATEQGYDGLDLAVATLTRLRREGLRGVVVHSLAPALGTPEAQREEEEFQVEAYRIFMRYVYQDTENAPQRETEGQHTPWVLRFDNDLMRFGNLADRREQVFGADYAALRERIEEIGAPEDAEDEVEG